MLSKNENINVKFTKRAIPIPYNYRLSYKISQLCLILSLAPARRGSGSPITRIQMLANALLSDEEMERFLFLVDDVIKNYTVRYDPVVTRVLKYALYDGLIMQQKNEKYNLTDKGKKYVEVLLKDKELLKKEKEFLQNHGKKLKDKKIEALMNYWRYEVAVNK